MSEVLEAEIRDILANYPRITEEILRTKFKFKGILSLRAKEKPLNGRLDLLFDCGNILFLLELKIREAKKRDLNQLMDYCKALAEMIIKSELPRYESIKPILLCPEVPTISEYRCEKKECTFYENCEKTIYIVEYSIGGVLSWFAQEEVLSSKFHIIRPVNLGAYKFYFNKLLRYILQYGPKSEEDLAKAPIFYGRIRKPGSRLKTYLKEAEIFNLIEINFGGRVRLTPLGEKYALNEPEGLADPSNPEKISRKQAEYLREYIIRNPLENPTIYGIYSLVETVYELSKNTYPVPANVIHEYFTLKVGKMYDWKDENTRRFQVRFFGQYSEQLGLTLKVGDKYYITPGGINLVQHLQLSKAKAMI